MARNSSIARRSASSARIKSPEVFSRTSSTRSMRAFISGCRSSRLTSASLLVLTTSFPVSMLASRQVCILYPFRLSADLVSRHA